MTDDRDHQQTTGEQDHGTIPTAVREGIRDALIPLATADPDCEIETGIDTETRIHTETGIDTETRTDTETDVGTGTDSDELARVGELLGEATVIGLGEATHGTREFYQLKHRLIRLLVREHGVRAVALEANLPETMALAEYVRRGEGDPRSALAGMHYEHLQVESVLALVEWLREFNLGRDPDDRVAIYGVDAVFTHGAVQRLRAHFETVDPAFLKTVEDDLAAVDDDGVALARADDEPAAFAAAERVVPELGRHLDSHRESHVSATSERAWRRARQYVRVIERAIENARAFFDHDPRSGDVTGEMLAIRERAMADNVAWLREYATSDSLVLWAHDAHLNRVTYPFPGSDPSTNSMGRYLADRHGTDYFALGFSLGRGSFRAVSAADEDGEVGEHSLAAPLPNTIDAVLAGFNESVAFLDLGAARDDDRTADWFAQRRSQFQIGGTFDPDNPSAHLVEYVYPEAYDGLCFVAATTPIRPLRATDTDG